MLRVRLLGGLAVEADGRTLAPPRGRAASLLAWLAFNPGVHPRSRVAGRFWPGVLEESARASLRRTLSDLRGALGDAGSRHLEASRNGVGLPDSDDVWVDARAFDRLIADGRDEEALALCDGDLLADIDDDWALAAQDEHRERLSALLARLIARASAEEAVRLARRRATLDPLSEDAGRSLIVALAEIGDRPAALAAYERLRERLARDLRIAPTAATRLLADEVRDEAPAARLPSRKRPALANGMGAAEQPVPRPPLPRPLLDLCDGPFLGREEWLCTLRSAHQRASRGERRALVVSGEAGIGKSRLVAEFCRDAHARGATVLYGRCYEDPVPYEPFVEALRDYVGSGDPAALRASAGPGAAELSRLVPELASPETGDAWVGDPDGARYRLFDAVDSLLATTTGAVAAILALDDLHWADRATLALLRHLTRSPNAAPLLLLLTYRLGEAAPHTAANALLPGLRGTHLIERKTLRGLAEGEIRALASDRLGDAVPAKLAADLHRRSEGNPFFCEELLRALADARATGYGDAALLAELELPGRVRDVIERRLVRLDRAARRVLATAAGIGREFAVDVIELLDDVEERDLLDAIDAAIDAELIEEIRDRPGHYRFAHALVGETIYTGISATRRARLHAAIAVALERSHGEHAAEHAAEISRHLLAALPVAADPSRAAEYARLAGDQAMRQLAYEDAANRFEQALGALALHSTPSPERLAVLRLRLGDARTRAGDSHRGREAYEMAAQEARRLGDDQLLARAALGFAGIGLTILNVDPRIVSVLEEALRELDDASPPLRARLLARLAVELYYAHPRERSEALAAEAIAAARGADDEPSLVEALGARHVALWRPDRLGDRQEIAREMIALASHAGDREGELLGWNWLAADLFEAGDLSEFERAVESHERLANELNLPAFRWYGPLWRGALATVAGRLEDARNLAAEGRRIGLALRAPNATLFADLLLWNTQLLRGAFDETLQLFQTQSARVAPSSPAHTAWLCGLTWMHAGRGARDAARELLDELAADDFASLPFDVNWPSAMGELAEACALLDDAGRAEILYRRLQPFAGRHITATRGIVSFGSSSRHLGLLAATCGRHAEANAHFETALRENELLGARPWLDWTRVQYAESLIAGGETRDGVAALLSASRRDASELGLDGLLARIQKLERAPES